MEGLIEYVDPRLAELGVRAACSVISGVAVERSHPVLLGMLRKEEEFFKASFASHSDLLEHPNVAAFRQFYWRLGIDPTKTRPSHEALARRVLHGRRIPSINNIVDIGNMLSLSRLVPIGLYDADKVEAPLSLKMSGGGEYFKPIGGEAREIEPGSPILVDLRGTVIHIYGHRDSDETKVVEGTRRILAIVYGVPPIGVDYLVSVLEEFVSHVKIFSNAEAEPGPVYVVGG
jgi:DNA/RNA-binding domain of Phe-tRNA-synthetase-like protein